MNRLQVLKQRAARAGIGILRSPDPRKGWDVVDSCGPRGLSLTRREAIVLASGIALHKPKIRMYGTDVKGQWHRWNCEKVAAPSVKPTSCQCGRLVVH
jgi:hypothetical protein